MRLAYPTPQLGLNPLATQGDAKKLQHGNDENDDRDVSEYNDVNSIHGVRSDLAACSNTSKRY